MALYMDPSATLDDLREAVTTLEEMERTARRVLGGAPIRHSGTLNDACEKRERALAAREGDGMSSVCGGDRCEFTGDRGVLETAKLARGSGRAEKKPRGRAKNSLPAGAAGGGGAKNAKSYTRGAPSPRPACRARAPS